MRCEVEVLVHHPLDPTARQFLDGVIRSANKVVGYRAAGEEALIVTVDAHGMDEEGAKRAAVREVAAIYPQVPFGIVGASGM